MRFFILIILLTHLFSSCDNELTEDETQEAIQELTNDSLVVYENENRIKEKQKSDLNLNNTIDSVSYALGVNVANKITEKGISKINLLAFATAMNDVMKNNEPAISQKQTNGVINSYLEKDYYQTVRANIKAGDEFMAKNIKGKKVRQLENGVQVEIISEGTGEPVGNQRLILVHYETFQVNGRLIDSSIKKRKPLKLVVARDPLLKAWKEVLPLMKNGSKWKICVPPYLAYGMEGYKTIVEPYETLIFEIQIVGVE